MRTVLGGPHTCRCRISCLCPAMYRSVGLPDISNARAARRRARPRRGRRAPRRRWGRRLRCWRQARDGARDARRGGGAGATRAEIPRGGTPWSTLYVGRQGTSGRSVAPRTKGLAGRCERAGERHGEGPRASSAERGGDGSA
jgi:hypothetical protein